MKSFNEHINESASEFKLVDEFAQISGAKPLVLKYVMFFNDKSIRDKVEVMYNTHDDTFSIQGKSTYFNRSKRVTSNPIQAYNYVKEIMVAEELSLTLSEALREFTHTSKSSFKPWKEFLSDFVDQLIKDKVNITKKDQDILEISDTLLTAKKFGI